MVCVNLKTSLCKDVPAVLMFLFCFILVKPRYSEVLGKQSKGDMFRTVHWIVWTGVKYRKLSEKFT